MLTRATSWSSLNKPPEFQIRVTEGSRIDEQYNPIIEEDGVYETKHQDTPAGCRTSRGTYRQLEMVLIGRLEWQHEEGAHSPRMVYRPLSEPLSQYMFT